MDHRERLSRVDRFATGIAASVVFRLVGSRVDKRGGRNSGTASSRLQLAAVFVVTAVAVGAGDYLITSDKTVALSTVIGIGCGFIVLYVSRKQTPRDDT